MSGTTKYATLHPGDIILKGRRLEQTQPGDVMEAEIPGIGVLRDPVIAEK